MSARLPVLPTVAAAYRDVFGNFPGFLRSIWIIALLLVLFFEVPMLFLTNYIAKNVIPEYQRQIEEKKKAIAENPDAAAEEKEMKPEAAQRNLMLLVATFGLSVVQMTLLFCFMQGWYRQLLVGENKDKPVRPRLGKPEWYLMWTSVKAGFVLLPFMVFAVGLVSAAYSKGANAPPEFNIMPYLVPLVLGMLYMQARMALAYPASAMDEYEAPIRQSWNMTRQQGWRLVLGNLATIVPVFIGIVAIFAGLSWGISQILPLPETTVVNTIQTTPLVVSLFLKVVGVFCMLTFLSLLSAYHAHAYAYLVRSSSSISSS